MPEGRSSATSYWGDAGVPTDPKDKRKQYDALFDKYATDFATADLLRALAEHESDFNPSAANPKSTALGLFQILKKTAMDPGYGVTPMTDPSQRLDPEASTRFASQYLTAMGQQFGGDPAQALAAYYMGPGAAALGIPNDVQQNYVNPILQGAGMGGQPQQPMQYGPLTAPSPMQELPPINYDPNRRDPFAPMDVGPNFQAPDPYLQYMPPFPQPYEQAQMQQMPMQMSPAMQMMGQDQFYMNQPGEQAMNMGYGLPGAEMPPQDPDDQMLQEAQAATQDPHPVRRARRIAPLFSGVDPRFAGLMAAAWGRSFVNPDQGLNMMMQIYQMDQQQRLAQQQMYQQQTSDMVQNLMRFGLYDQAPPNPQQDPQGYMGWMEDSRRKVSGHLGEVNRVATEERRMRSISSRINTVIRVNKAELDTKPEYQRALTMLDAASKRLVDLYKEYNGILTSNDYLLQASPQMRKERLKAVEEGIEAAKREITRYSISIARAQLVGTEELFAELRAMLGQDLGEEGAGEGGGAPEPTGTPATPESSADVFAEEFD